jgi:hypothetical protein
MINQSYLSIVARNEDWREDWSSEPQECSWASEAIFFVRVLKSDPSSGPVTARVQMSPDGLHWIDEGTVLEIPAAEGVVFSRVRHFGGWLRLAGTMQAGALRVLCYLHLKE